MDWIQISYIVLQVLGFGAICHLHGKPRDGYSIWSWLIGTIINIPFAGRILGWW